jgi:hypothetical protein
MALKQAGAKRPTVRKEPDGDIIIGTSRGECVTVSDKAIEFGHVRPSRKLLTDPDVHDAFCEWVEQEYGPLPKSDT